MEKKVPTFAPAKRKETLFKTPVKARCLTNF